jgi:hypothetical protein
MPSPGTASYKRIYRRVAAAHNAIDRTTYTGATPTIDDRRKVEGMFRDSIVAFDAAVQRAICLSEKSPHRIRYLAYSSALAYTTDGAPAIPDHYGPIGQVIIQPYSGADYVAGIEADSVEQINQWRENVGSIFGSLAHNASGSAITPHFIIEGVRLNYTGYQAKVEIANIVVAGEADSPPALGSPDAFEDVIFAGAASEAYMEGDDMAELEKRRAYVEAAMPLILAGETSAPPLQK